MDSVKFSNVYQEGLPRTIRFLLSLGFPRDTVNEIAQTAWSRAWEKQDQLRDESKLLSWVNTIALNDARKTIRRERQHIGLTTRHECVTKLNVAAIDVAKILELCAPKDREILEAQLNGISNLQLAHEHGVSDSAMRLRCFRARRAAREACDPIQPPEVTKQELDDQLSELTRRFRQQCLAFAAQHLESAETFLRLFNVTTDRAKRLKLHRHAKKSIQNALKSLSHVPAPGWEVARGRQLAEQLKRRLQHITASDLEEEESVA